MFFFLVIPKQIKKVCGSPSSMPYPIDTGSEGGKPTCQSACWFVMPISKACVGHWFLLSYGCQVNRVIVWEPGDGGVIIPTTGMELIKVGVFPDQ